MRLLFQLYFRSIRYRTIFHKRFKLGLVYYDSYLHKRHWQFHCTQLCRFDAISLHNLLEQLVDPILNVWLRASDAKYFDLFLLLPNWAAFSIYYSVDGHAATTLCAGTENYQVQWSLHNDLSGAPDWSTIFLHKVRNLSTTFQHIQPL